MPTFNAIVTQNTTPAISVTLSGNTTYQMFKNSLGNFTYWVQRAYLSSTNQPQIQGAFLYSKYDSNGTENLQSVVSAISPYQYYSSIYLELREKKLILDGRDYIRFRMYPNTQLIFKLFVYRMSNTQEYDLSGNNEFLKLENQEGYFDFFDDYKDLL